jgi:hypothetical protein
MKKIGFHSFGHWTPSSRSQARWAADTLLQSIDLAVAAEEVGADGAYFRVHHFARQLASPFPLLAAVGVKTRRIEIDTAVIDMRYENPFYMAEDAGAADLIAGGRLQLGISRGSPEQVIDGWQYFGYPHACSNRRIIGAPEPEAPFRGGRVNAGIDDNATVLPDLDHRASDRWRVRFRCHCPANTARSQSAVRNWKLPLENAFCTSNIYRMRYSEALWRARRHC